MLNLFRSKSAAEPVYEFKMEEKTVSIKVTTYRFKAKNKTHAKIIFMLYWFLYQVSNRHFRFSMQLDSRETITPRVKVWGAFLPRSYRRLIYRSMLPNGLKQDFSYINSLTDDLLAEAKYEGITHQIVE